MNTIYSSYTASVSELKKNPSNLIEKSGGEAIAILNHNRPTAYLVPAARYEEMLESIEDAHWMKVVEDRKGEKSQAQEISLDDL